MSRRRVQCYCRHLAIGILAAGGLSAMMAGCNNAASTATVTADASKSTPNGVKPNIRPSLPPQVQVGPPPATK